MSLRLDFTTRGIIKPANTVKNHIFMDIGTSNFKLLKNRITEAEIISDSNSTNFDKEAIKTSLNNILHFKTGDSPLLPEFGIGQLYELLYSTTDKYTIEKISKTVNSIIATWEPRISIISMPIENDDKTIKITINYSIPALNTYDSFIYSFER